MESRLKRLRIFSLVFKTLAMGTFFLMVVGVVGIVINRQELAGAFPVALLNVISSFSVVALIFYTLGDLIQVVLSIESQTRRS